MGKQILSMGICDMLAPPSPREEKIDIQVTPRVCAGGLNFQLLNQ